MKRFLTLLTVALMAFTFSFAQTKKDSTPDKRFKGNRSVKQKPVTHDKSQ